MAPWHCQQSRLSSSAWGPSVPRTAPWRHCGGAKTHRRCPRRSVARQWRPMEIGTRHAGGKSLKQMEIWTHIFPTCPPFHATILYDSMILNGSWSSYHRWSQCPGMPSFSAACISSLYPLESRYIRATEVDNTVWYLGHQCIDMIWYDMI